MGISARGWTMRRTSWVPCLSIRITRSTFMPPAVEPPQPPMKAMNIISTGRKSGQWAKSTVPNPVLVTTETTTKPALRIPSTTVVPGCSRRRIVATSSTAPSTMTRKPRTSMSRR